jgi:hypothetical protein
MLDAATAGECRCGAALHRRAAQWMASWVVVKAPAASACRTQSTMGFESSIVTRAMFDMGDHLSSWQRFGEESPSTRRLDDRAVARARQSTDAVASMRAGRGRQGLAGPQQPVAKPPVELLPHPR